MRLEAPFAKPVVTLSCGECLVQEWFHMKAVIVMLRFHLAKVGYMRTGAELSQFLSVHVISRCCRKMAECRFGAKPTKIDKMSASLRSPNL